MGDMLQFIQNPANSFGTHTATTLQLTILPTLLAILIGVPIGVLVAPSRAAAFLATNLSGVARAIPTFVFLAVMVPLIGIGVVPGTIALTALGIPPILLNTVAGMRGVDPAAVDAARGMGMTGVQVLRRVQLPLVVPVVAAGVRTAAVQIAATVPLAAAIGAGGYGDYILQGINLGPAGQTAVVVGALATAILALIVEGSLAWVQRALTPAGLRPNVAQVVGPSAEDEAEPAREQLAA